MTQNLEIFLLSLSPVLVVIAFLLFTLLVLRMRARGKSNRMSNAEMYQTGIGATTWDSYQGTSTQGPSTTDSFDSSLK